MTIKIALSSICRAFEPTCVGTKVRSRDLFLHQLVGAVAAFDLPDTRGQARGKETKACPSSGKPAT